ncbi:MAG: TRAFs-binding domain-containing protein [Acidimicrobiia bacterium]|nr:TRAFs-binding domain-containing protein [Acidimicrobiia bacterium]
MARPICFVVMPFSTKETQLGPDAPGPKKVDFDALWERAFRPAIEAAGYTPVRADQDAGALIIVEMIQRLAMSDLVVADISIGNANVYYEIGVRHAAQRYGCVLVSANWAHVLFDIDQMPRVVYTMDEGAITDATATAIRAQVERGIDALREGESPVYAAVPGFPESAKDDVRVTQFKEDMESLNELLGRIRSIRRLVDTGDQKRAALELRDELGQQEVLQDGVSIEAMELLRDCVGWEAMKAWIEAMPDLLRTRPSIQEQLLLAVSKSGDPKRAIGALEQLIESAGDSSERQGLLGGRYKKLWDTEIDEANRAVYLDRAIEHYERGMMLDLNDYYPSCNLPRLYRARREVGDADRARLAGSIALKAAERARALDPEDEWLRPTLLGAAFDAQDVLGAESLGREVKRDRPGTWKLATTIVDLRVSASQAEDPDVATSLAKTYNDLNRLLPDAQQSKPLNTSVAATNGKKATESKKGKRKGKKKGKQGRKSGKK